MPSISADIAAAAASAIAVGRIATALAGVAPVAGDIVAVDATRTQVAMAAAGATRTQRATAAADATPARDVLGAMAIRSKSVTHPPR